MAGTKEGAAKARQKLSDDAKAAGLSVAEYRDHLRAAKLTSPETQVEPTIVQVEPEPVAAGVTPPPAGTPSVAPAGPVAVADSSPVSPAPEPEPVYPLAEFLHS